VVGLHIRTPLASAVVGPALVREIHALDANVAPGELIPMREQIERTTASQRIALTMLMVFGALALVLAGIGLYGVMAATVAQGTGSSHCEWRSGQTSRTSGVSCSRVDWR
jgi:hypothetical protein